MRKGSRRYTNFERTRTSKTPKLGENVVVIGGGNVAIDSARSIWRLGKR